MEILKVDFGWEFASTETTQAPITPPSTRRRHASRPESIPSPVSPRSSTRRKVEKPAEQIKKTRSGRTIKIPQVDGVSDTESEPETIPQFDGHNGQQQQQQAGHRGNYGNEQSGGYFVGEQTTPQTHHHQNGPFPGVIPILMPPGRHLSSFRVFHFISFR